MAVEAQQYQHYLFDTGSATPALNTINILGDLTTATTTGSGDTITITALGSGITTIDGDSGSMTGSTVTISGGSTGLTTSASVATMDLTGTLIVSNGGTGDASFTAYAPVCGGTTTTAHLQSADTGIATSGFVLTSNGNASLPSFQNVSISGAVTTIDGDSGSATPTSGVITISGGSTGLTTTASGSTVDITGILDLASGGTSANLTANDGGIFYSTASAGAILFWNSNS